VIQGAAVLRLLLVDCARGLSGRAWGDGPAGDRPGRGTLVSRSQLTIRSANESVNALLAGENADAPAVRRYRETIASGELAEGIDAFTKKRSPEFVRHPR
jgi:hypothetical protein